MPQAQGVPSAFAQAAEQESFSKQNSGPLDNLPGATRTTSGGGSSRWKSAITQVLPTAVLTSDLMANAGLQLASTHQPQVVSSK